MPDSCKLALKPQILAKLNAPTLAHAPLRELYLSAPGHRAQHDGSDATPPLWRSATLTAEELGDLRRLLTGRRGCRTAPGLEEVAGQAGKTDQGERSKNAKEVKPCSVR